MQSIKNDGCCIILAAGQGKRMHAAGSKVLCEVAGKPMLGWVIDAARSAGIDDICVVASGDDVKKAADGCTICEQKERLGTGHAVMCARDFLQKHAGGSTLVLCGDAPFIDKKTIEGAYKSHIGGGCGVTVITARVENAGSYGRIIRNDSGLEAIVEAVDCTAEQLEINEINSGAYWFDTAALLASLDRLTDSNAQHEYYLTDAVSIISKSGRPAGCYAAESANIALGANSPADLLQLNETARREAIGRHLAGGVHFVNVDGVVIGPDVEIAPGATILPGTQLYGKTKIGAGAEIGPNSLLVDCTVGKNSVINASQCRESQVGANAKIGPFVQLRPNSNIGDEVKIGDFVEIKNSTIGRGTSVAHLTYVGDADVGSCCNFGCGVVFVNYDGVSKNRTTVGDYAFIGCNTNLVAPVTVGDGAYTAAGTTVTNDVPAGALAVGRARQRNLDGWAANKLKAYIAKKSKK